MNWLICFISYGYIPLSYSYHTHTWLLNVLCFFLCFLDVLFSDWSMCDDWWKKDNSFRFNWFHWFVCDSDQLGISNLFLPCVCWLVGGYHMNFCFSTLMIIMFSWWWMLYNEFSFIIVICHWLCVDVIQRILFVSVVVCVYCCVLYAGKNIFLQIIIIVFCFWVFSAVHHHFRKFPTNYHH